MPRLAYERTRPPRKELRCMNQVIITSTSISPRLQHQSCNEEPEEGHGTASNNVVCLAGAA